MIHAPLRENYQVFGCDLTGPFAEQIFKVDISQEEEVNHLFDNHGPFPRLVHLAADPEVDAPWGSVLRNNITGTRNVYHAASKHGTQRVVFASSNHVTGAYEGFPPHLHKETDPESISPSDAIRPDSEYGVSKAFGEVLARYYYERCGMASVCLRIGSVLEDDDPSHDPRHTKTWLSHRDLLQLVRKSLTAEVGFGIYYGVSGNTGRFWDLSNARADLGYHPEDNATEEL